MFRNSRRWIVDGVVCNPVVLFFTTERVRNWGVCFKAFSRKYVLPIRFQKLVSRKIRPTSLVKSKGTVYISRATRRHPCPECFKTRVSHATRVVRNSDPFSRFYENHNPFSGRTSAWPGPKGRVNTWQQLRRDSAHTAVECISKLTPMDNKRWGSGAESFVNPAVLFSTAERVRNWGRSF